MAVTNFVVLNATSNAISLEGDGGNYRTQVPGAGTLTINPKDLVGNYLLCTQLSTFVTSGTVSVSRGSTTVTAADLTALGQGADMITATYDANVDEVSDLSQGQKATNVTAIDDSDSPYTVLSTDSILLCDTSTDAITVNLPAASSNAYRVLEIKDRYGDFGTKAVTLAPNGTDVLEGTNTTMTLNTPFQYLKLLCDGTQWNVVSDGARTLTRTFTISPTDSQADETDTACFTAPAAGTITGVSAVAGTGADTTETAEVDVKIDGTSCLSSVITLDNAAGTTAQAGSIDAANDDIANGDAVTFSYDWTTGGGTDTLADVVVTITYALS